MAFAPPVPARQTLSPREGQVLQRLASGQSNIEIARAMFLSEKTVSSHKTNLMLKLRVENIPDLVRYADQQLPRSAEADKKAI